MAFQGYLKSDTATVIQLGPFVAIADGVTYVATEKEEMNHATTGIRISKNGGALAARTTLTEPVYDAFGYYLVNLDATDTATPGRLKVIYGSAAVVLPCEADFCVIPHELWDTLFVTQPCAAINKFFDKATPTGTVNSLPDAVAGAANGLFIAGTNAAVTVTGATVLTGAVSMAAGLAITQSGAGGNGVSITGNGAGTGVTITGGSTSGTGLAVVGGASNGIAIYAVGDGSGEALRLDGGDGEGSAVEIIGGATNGKGITITGTGTGSGVVVTSGTGATGDAVQMTAASTAGNGLKLTGTTTGEGLNLNSMDNTGTTVLSGSVTVSGDVQFSEDIQVVKTTTLTGNVVLSDGLTVSAPSTLNRAGVTITGNGTGAGVTSTGGATGPGALLTGGGNNANADGLRTIAGGALALDIDSVVITALGTDTDTIIGNVAAISGVVDDIHDVDLPDIPTNAELIAELNKRRYKGRDRFA